MNVLEKIGFANHMVAAHGGGRVVSASGSKTSVSGSTPASAIIYDAYTSIKKKKKKKKKKKSHGCSYIEVVEWSARLARKRAYGVRRLLAPLSKMHILL